MKNLVDLIKEFRDYFAWDYDEMPGLSRDLVEHKLSLWEGCRPVKQASRRVAPEVILKIKAEVERLLNSKFIQTTRYVDWLSNVIPVVKKNSKMRVCIDFWHLNATTPKDEYPMPIADMLVDTASGHELLSCMDGHAGYNKIFIPKRMCRRLPSGVLVLLGHSAFWAEECKGNLSMSYEHYFPCCN